MFRPILLLVCTTPTGQEMSGVVRMMGVEDIQRQTAKESHSSVTTSVSLQDVGTNMEVVKWEAKKRVSIMATSGSEKAPPMEDPQALHLETGHHATLLTPIAKTV